MNNSEVLNENQIPEGRQGENTSRRTPINEGTDLNKRQDKSSDRNAYPNLSDRDYKEGLSKIRETARSEQHQSF